MRFSKVFIVIVLQLFLFACGNSDSQKSGLSITINKDNNIAVLGDTVQLELNNPNNLEISSVNYVMNSDTVESTFSLDDAKLGVHEITATVNYDDKTETITTKITILNNASPKVYGYRILNTYPHDITSYTQGLEFYQGELFESTGQYENSKLRKVNYKTGDVLENIDLAKQYFGEGLTIINDKLYQLTWRENLGFVYTLNPLEKTGSFKYGQSKEGWGICNDGKQLYKSDGTENIWLLDPGTLAETDKIQVYTNKGKIIGMNEMEYIDGKIYANRYQKNGVAIINPSNGAIEGVIDFSPLRDLVTQHPDLDVLNGIAYNPETQTIFVTGKLWDKLFEVEVFEK